ncbi:MAG: tetratricopeptide repeat protein [bacterium]
MTAHKLTRKELKQDSFVQWTSRAVDFIQDNYLRLAIGAVAVVVLIVAVSFFTRGQVQARESAAALLFQGQQLLGQGEYGAAEQRLQECRESYGGTMFGKQACLDLAQALMIQGQDARALDIITEGLQDAGSDLDTARALNKMKASCLMNLQQYDGAISLYRDLLAGATVDNERFDLVKRLASSLKLTGQLPAAISVLEELQRDVDLGEVKLLQTRELETMIHTYRALDM